MPTLLLDTNFFRNFVEKEAFFNKANAHLANRYRGVPRNEMALFVSPFAFLEYLGITVEPPNLPPGIIGDQPIETWEAALNLAVQVYEVARAHFEAHPRLSPENFADKLRHRDRHVLPRAKEHWTIATRRYSQAENRSILIHCLAIEYVQKIQLKRNQAKIYHASLWLDASRKISEGMDVCMFRTIQWRWSDENRHERISQFGLDLVNRLYKAMGVRLYDDLVDAELVHYATFGKIAEGQLVAVDTYTCDPNQKIKDRIGVFYAGLTKAIYEVNLTISRNPGRWDFPFPMPAPGTVTFFDASGDMVEGPLNVSDLVRQSESAQVH